MNDDTVQDHRTDPATELLLATAHLDLMAMDDRAIPELHRIAMLPAVRRSWRTRGNYIPPSEWANLLFGQSLFQCYALCRDDGRIVGYTELFDASALDGYAHLSTFSHPDVWRTGLPVEHVVGTLALAFDRFPLRKVVAHLPVGNLARLGGLDSIADHVGTLREHVLIDGTYSDVAVFEITRAEFRRVVDGRLGTALRFDGVAPVPGRSAPGSGTGQERDAALAAFDGWIASLSSTSHGPPTMDELDSLHWLEMLDLVETALGRLIDPEALRSAGSLDDVRLFLESQLQP